MPKKPKKPHTTYLMSEDLFKGNIRGRGSYEEELEKAQRFYKAAGIDFKVVSDLTTEIRKVQTENLILGSHGWGNAFYNKDYETGEWKGADYNALKNAAGSSCAKNIYATGCNVSWSPKEKHVKESPMKTKVAKYVATPADTTTGITVFTPGRPGLGKTRYHKEIDTVVSPDAIKAMQAIDNQRQGFWKAEDNGYWMEQGISIPRPKTPGGTRQLRFTPEETKKLLNSALIKSILDKAKG